MPCMELFDKQSEEYKKDLIRRKFFSCYIRGWKYYSLAKIYKNKGLNLGIDQFGESAHTKKFMIILI